jgi:hypothetical protein
VSFRNLTHSYGLMVRYREEIRKVPEAADSVAGSRGRLQKMMRRKRWLREEEHVGPALILLRIPFAPLLSTPIFPRDEIPINRENAVCASGI